MEHGSSQEKVVREPGERRDRQPRQGQWTQVTIGGGERRGEMNQDAACAGHRGHGDKSR